MALVYKRSTKNAARRYERSSGMEPNRGLRSNPGVNALTVVNSGRAPKRGSDGRFLSRPSGRAPSANPFQWIAGRKRHIRESPPYRTLRGAKAWREKHPDSGKGRGRVRLYATDEYGTVLTKAIPERMLTNPTRRSGMAYNIGALRRAMRANYGPGGVDDPGASSLFAAARAIDTGGRSSTARKKRPSARRPRSSRPAESASVGGMTIVSTGSKPRRTRKRSTAAKKAASKKTTARTSGRGGSRRASKRTAASAKKADRTRKRNASKRAASRTSTRSSKRRSSKRRSSKRRASRRGSKRRSSKRLFFHGRKVRLTGREYIDKYLTRGLMPTITRVGRLPLGRSGSPAIMTYPIPRTAGRLSRRSSVRGSARRGYAVGATYRGRRKRRMSALAANRRRSRRSSRRRGSRRGSRRRNSRRRVSRNQRWVVANRRSSRRGSRRRMTRNMLAVSKLKYRGSGSNRVGTPKGRYYQLVEYGPKSGRKFRHAGYPVLVPPHVSRHAYVRTFRFGGAAKDAHARAKASGYAERRRYSRWRKPPASWVRKSSKKKMTANRRSSRRRSSMRENQKWVVMNRRRKHGRRVRRNVAGLLGGADLMHDVVTPVIGGTVGFVAARVLSNGLANVEQLRGMLDSGADAAGAANTKIAANLLGIAATLGLSTKVDIIRQNRGALVTGMGLALTDRLIQRFTAGSPHAAYLGEYVSQPMSGLGETMYATAGIGEYVSQPMSGLGETMYAAAGVGEYVDQPMSGMGATMYAAAGYDEGVDPADQSNVDRMMNGMEGSSAMQAAAGMGIMQAAAGMGEADANLQAMWSRDRPGFTSIQMPEGVAMPVTATLPLDRQVQTSLVTPEAKVGTLSTPEGRGFAGGLFARNLFAGMF